MAQVNMYWYSGSAWRETDELYAYDGLWKQVMECYIWDGSWKLCHYAPGSLDSFNIFDTSIGCDPTEGSFQATWTYTTPSTSMWTIKLDYSFDSGANWNLYNTYNLTDSPIDESLNGFVGFTSLDNTKFRLRMELNATNAISGSNAPRFKDPPYIC
jgi:hypothetical protein